MTEATPKIMSTLPCPACAREIKGVPVRDQDCGRKLIPELAYMDGSGTEYADEVVKRWNAHADLLAALEAVEWAASAVAHSLCPSCLGGKPHTVDEGCKVTHGHADEGSRPCRVTTTTVGAHFNARFWI